MKKNILLSFIFPAVSLLPLLSISCKETTTINNTLDTSNNTIDIDNSGTTDTNGKNTDSTNTGTTNTDNKNIGILVLALQILMTKIQTAQIPVPPILTTRKMTIKIQITKILMIQILYNPIDFIECFKESYYPLLKFQK